MAKARKARINASVGVNAYAVIDRAVEEGVAVGWNRAHKHTDTPDAEHVKNCIHDSVLSDLAEVLLFNYEA